MKRITGLFFLIVVCFTAPGQGDAADLQELAKIATEKAQRTSSAKLTWEDIYAKLDKACNMLQEQGLEKGLPRMRGDSEYVFKGTYLWVHNLDFVMLMHPMKPELEGKNIKDYRDQRGNLLFQEMNRRVKASPDNISFVDYYWPKPGVEGKAFPKRSVVQMCDIGEKKVIVGCGKYLD